MDLRFKEADDKAESHKLRIALRFMLNESEYSPAELQTRDEPVHWNFWKEIQERHETNNVGNHEHGLELHELVSMEVQLGG
jgi:hypothetical protein